MGGKKEVKAQADGIGTEKGKTQMLILSLLLLRITFQNFLIYLSIDIF